MVKFGAETIFKSNKSTITDEDIDAILAAGSQRTSDLNSKIKTDMQHSLQNFTLGGEQSLYDYVEKDFANLTAREANWNPLSNMILYMEKEDTHLTYEMQCKGGRSV